MDQYGPGQVPAATSQPWGLYYDDSEHQQTSPHASQPIAPTEPQDGEHWRKDEA